MLRRQKELYLVNSVDEDTVVFDGANLDQGFSINGVHFKCSDLVAINVECPCPGSKRVVRVVVQVPESCECPYSWSMTLRGGITGEMEQAFETFEEVKLYEYESPTGATPTAAAIATEIARQINKDKSGFVTATVAGAILTLTAKSEDKPFDAYTVQGVVTVLQAGSRSRLSGDAVRKIFPVNHGNFGMGRPQYPICSEYCKWTFKIKAPQQDISGPSHWLSYENEIEFFVSNSAPAYQTNWYDQIVAAIADCPDILTEVACEDSSPSPSPSPVLG